MSELGMPAHTVQTKRKSILEFEAEHARRFFLKAESYCNFDLPPYITFQTLLDDIDTFLDVKNIEDLIKKPRDYDDLNYVILSNKDGRYAWRPIQLIHPLLYVALVREITKSENWAFIKERFIEFADNPKIECLSLPVESLSKKKDSAEQVLSWWEQVEQRSIELALDYQCLAQTDISDCYGSIYTHSVTWALHTKPEAKKKENRNNKSLVGVLIDNYLQDMSYGQTNGIPQGSVMMDFIAEMVLGYVDLALTEKLKALQITDYKILRYRDDYRIFVNNPLDGESIIKELTMALVDIGLKLNPLKTMFSHEVVQHSIKKDKREFMGKKLFRKGLQKHLLMIHDHASKYPNAGSVVTALSKYFRRINNNAAIKEAVMPLISITVDIALRSPRSYPVVSAILSKLVSMLEETQKREVIEKIQKRFSTIANTNHMQIWLQRISITFAKDIKYEDRLCNLVAGEKIEIWNNEWIKSEGIKKIINTEKIIDNDVIANIPSIIDKGEFELFAY